MLHIFKNITSFLKKAFIVIVVYIIIINLFSYFFNENRPEISNNLIKNNRSDIYKVLNDKELNSTKQGKLQIAVFKTMLCTSVGEACTENPEDGNEYFNRSILGYVTSLITMPYLNPPASGVYWAASGLQDAGFIPNTYAAEGIGFAALKPFITIWKIFRDLSYALLVVVLVAIAFMIMFRVKLNPQTVIGVENSLPKIVITLILITFSFAIAGFLIDLMYVSMSLIISVMGRGGNFYDIGEFQNKYLNARSLNIFSGIFAANTFGGGFRNVLVLGHVFTDIFNTFPTIISAAVTIVINIIVTILLTKGFVGILKLIFGTSFNDVAATFLGIGGNVGNLPQLITMPIVYILAFIFATAFAPLVLAFLLGCLFLLTILFLFFRIFFMLFAAYLKIVFMIIFAPIFLLFNAIPGKNIFSYWLKNLIGELITFPIVLTLFLTGYLIINIIPNPGTLWKPPFLGAISAQSLLIFFGMGIIFMIPNYVKAIKELLGLKKMPMSMGLGTFFSGVGTGVGGATGILGQIGSVRLGLSAIGRGGGSGVFGMFAKPKESGGTLSAADQNAQQMQQMFGGGAKKGGQTT